MNNFNFDIDKLIPSDIKKAVAEGKQKNPVAKVEEEDFFEEEEVEEAVEDTDTEESDDYSSDEEDSEEDTFEETDELDVSDEGIDALLNGKAKKKAKPKPADNDAESDLSEFSDDEDYKYLTSEFNEDDEVLTRVNSLLKKAKGTNLLEKNKVVKELKQQVVKLKSKDEENAAELSQATEVLHAHRFDSLPKVQEDYVKPIRITQANIQKVLDLDGTGINVRAVVDCKSIADLNEVLENTTLSEDEETTVKQQWKRHRELVQNYVSDRESAKTNISKYIGSEITQDVKTRVFNKTFDKAVSNENLAYIKGWREDPEKEEIANDMVARAKKNFEIIVGMISNPVENVRSDASLGTIANYVIDNVHYAQIAEQHKVLEARSTKDKDTITKLAQRVKELMQDSGSLTGRPTGSNRVSLKPSKASSSNGRMTKSQSAANFLSSKNKLDSLL